MILKVDLSALHRAVAPLNHAVIDDFVITSKADKLTSIAEGLAKDLAEGVALGPDIPIGAIDGTQGILSYNGHQVMLYIPDQGDDIAAVLQDGKQGRKIHIAECSTLEKMRNSGRFGRYDVISRMDGMFPVFGTNSDTSGKEKKEADLGVCKNCLKILNYKCYDDLNGAGKYQVFNSFDFESFFETYSSYFKSLPASSSSKGAAYTSNWASISSRIRRQLNYHCEQCGVDLSEETRLLHVHHINGNKTDNRRENLRGLCVDCHKKQPHHGHLHVSRVDTLLINELRRKQHKFDVFDYDKLTEYADTALEGLTSKCRKFKLPTPDLGVMLKCGVKVVPLDLAWPRSKVAVLIAATDQSLLEGAGWTVFSVGSAMKDFELFQKKVR